MLLRRLLPETILILGSEFLLANFRLFQELQVLHGRVESRIAGDAQSEKKRVQRKSVEVVDGLGDCDQRTAPLIVVRGGMRLRHLDMRKYHLHFVGSRASYDISVWLAKHSLISGPPDVDDADPESRRTEAHR